MIVNWTVLAAVPFALAIGACSSRSSNTDTAAGVLPNDTSTTLGPTPTIPNPGFDTGMVLDTTGNKADSTHADSLMNDSTHKATTAGTKHHQTTKRGNTKKPS